MSLEAFLSSQKKLTLPRIAPPVRNKPKITRGRNKKKADYMADFETTTDESDCRVWAWGLVNINKPDY